MLTPDKERPLYRRRFSLIDMRKRLWLRVQAKPRVNTGVRASPRTEWLKRSLIGPVRLLKGEETLRHAGSQFSQPRATAPDVGCPVLSSTVRRLSTILRPLHQVKRAAASN